MEELAREGVLATGFFQVITLQLLAAGGQVRVVESRQAGDGVGIRHGFDIEDEEILVLHGSSVIHWGPPLAHRTRDRPNPF